MKYFFDAWTDFSTACRSASHILFLSDYDGTLTPIVSRPEEALLSPQMKDRLIDLAGIPGVSVGIISGRGLDEVKSMVGIEEIYYAGNHGLEIEGPELDYVNPEALKSVSVIAGLTQRFSELFRSTEGVIIQNKKFSMSVHYRLVKPEDVEMVATTVRETVQPYIDNGSIRLFPGKKVWEIRPPIDWDKGKAVESIRRLVSEKLLKSDILTVFLGDDTTDEDGFRVVRPPDGWSIYVGPETSQSSAGYYLKDTPEVGRLLQRLAALLPVSGLP